METPGQRIKNLRKTAKLTQKQIAEKLGLSTAAVTQWETDVTKPSGENLLALAHILNETPHRILFIDEAQDVIAGSIKHTKQAKENFQTEFIGIAEEAGLYSVYSTKGLIKVPLISWITAGKWSEAIDNFHPGDAEEWRETTANVSKQAFALRVEGDSMHNPNGSPSIPEGSIIIVDPEIEAVSGKIVVARLTDSNQVTLKKLIIDGPNTYLKPLNPDHSLIKVNGNCTIVGVVKQVIQDL